MSAPISDSSGADPIDNREVGGVRSGDFGPQTERTESGLTALKEMRMLNRAVRQGWLKGQRWPTEATPSELSKAKTQRELTVKEMAMAAVALNLDDAQRFRAEYRKEGSGIDKKLQLLSQRVEMYAVNVLRGMESQNQLDEITEIKAGLVREAGSSFSSAALDAIVSQCAAVVGEVIGDDAKSARVLELLSSRIRVDTIAQGTEITPDMEAAAMDASVPFVPGNDEDDDGTD